MEQTSQRKRSGASRSLPRAWIGAALVAAMGLPTSGCESLINASRSLQPAGFEDALTTFDWLSQRAEEDREPDDLAYTDVIPQRPWVYRLLDAIGIGALLRLAHIEGSPSPVRISNPEERSRELMEELVWFAKRDPSRAATAANRVLFVLDRDPSPYNRMQAIRALGDLLERFEIRPAFGPTPPNSDAARGRVSDLVAALQAGWPGDRDGDLPVGQREDYLRALTGLTAEPVPEAREQRALLVALSRAYLLEVDPELMEPTRQAFVAAFQQALSRGLSEAIESDDASVRLAAMREYLRLTGPTGPSELLAAIARPASVVSAGVHRFDNTPSVRRALIHACGQLPAKHAYFGAGGGPPPVEFLYETAKQDVEPGLRRLAIEALALVVGHDLDFETEWADAWWERFVLEGPPDSVREAVEAEEVEPQPVEAPSSESPVRGGL